MATLLFAMMQSLDGYVAGPDGGHALPMPDETLHRHFNDHMRRVTGSLYGRRMYEIMRYWEEDQPGQDEVGDDFAAAWRPKPKWVVSRTLTAVGPNATLVNGDLKTFVKALKAEQEGEIEVAGPELAGRLTELGLIDSYQLLNGDLKTFVKALKAEQEGEIEVAGPELAGRLTELGLIDSYQLYLCPVVLGGGKPFFAGPRPPLRLVASEQVGEGTMKLTYVPA